MGLSSDAVSQRRLARLLWTFAQLPEVIRKNVFAPKQNYCRPSHSRSRATAIPPRVAGGRSRHNRRWSTSHPDSHTRACLGKCAATRESGIGSVSFSAPWTFLRPCLTLSSGTLSHFRYRIDRLFGKRRNGALRI